MAWKFYKVLEVDPEMGIREDLYYDEERDRIRVETIQVVDPILAISKALHAQTDQRARFGGDGFGPRVAQIPMVLWQQLMAKGIVQDRRAFSRWLNDKDNADLRTRPGRV